MQCVITVFGFMQIGYALEEILNPKMKKRRAHEKGKNQEQEVYEVFARMIDISEEDAFKLKTNEIV